MPVHDCRSADVRPARGQPGDGENGKGCGTKLANSHALRLSRGPASCASTSAHQFSNATSRSASPPNVVTAKDPSGLTTPFGRGTDTVATACL